MSFLGKHLIFFVKFEFKNQKFINFTQNLFQFKPEFQPDVLLASDNIANLYVS